MGEAVECEGLIHEKYNFDEQLKNFINEVGEIQTCGTRLISSQLDGTKKTCSISIMNDCVNMVTWSDKTITF